MAKRQRGSVVVEQLTKRALEQARATEVISTELYTWAEYSSKLELFLMLGSIAVSHKFLTFDHYRNPYDNSLLKPRFISSPQFRLFMSGIIRAKKEVVCEYSRETLDAFAKTTLKLFQLRTCLVRLGVPKVISEELWLTDDFVKRQIREGRLIRETTSPCACTRPNNCGIERCGYVQAFLFLRKASLPMISLPAPR